ncbi:hypothetical protein C8Q78DRAFT_1078718 [Trametes maxima]|nr:hypothetical protein C8Q78DRAFT_1078718 [Trametes maxima]
MSNELPWNWLDEFTRTVVQGDGTVGSYIEYKCKKCDVPTYHNKNLARRHAIIRRHRERFPPEDARPDSLEHEASSGWTSPTQSEEQEADLNGSQDSDADDDSGAVSVIVYHQQVSAGPMQIDDLTPVIFQIPPLYAGGYPLRFSPEGPAVDALGYASDHSDLESLIGESRGSDLYDNDNDSTIGDLPQSELEGDGDAASSDEDAWEDTDTETTASDSDSSPEPGIDSDDSFSEGSQDTPGSPHTRRARKCRKNRYFPYPNRTWCILDIVLNLPRHPISDELLKIFLWALKVLGVKSVPSLKAFRKFQAKLRGERLFKKERTVVSVLGNHFTENSVLKSIMLDMANPEVRRHLVFYPEEPINGSSELRHSWKWFLGLPDDKLTPMWAHRGLHFYVGEAAQLADGNIVVPLRWFLRAGEMHMFYYATHLTEEGRYVVDTTERRQAPASALLKNLPILLQEEQVLGFLDYVQPAVKPLS